MNASNKHLAATSWVGVCAIDDILPNTGVCALVGGEHVGLFRVGQDQFFGIENIDPITGASVISRGLIGSLGDSIVVASPLYKHHFDLRTGRCLEDEALSLRTYPVEVRDGQVGVLTA